MTLSVEDLRELEVLEARLKTILPEDYQESYEELEPVPMRSAGLKYNADGRVAWNEIWGSFCDLAMAGGPPHKGTLLEPGRAPEIEAQHERYEAVAEEICRGVMMAAQLEADPSPLAGWVRVTCLSEAMAGWLHRAIAMENVAVRRDGAALDLPAAPHFRLEKEIKNVVTVIAKTSHYWLEHMPRSQQRAIAHLFAALDRDSPLIVPGAWEWSSEHEAELRASIGDRIARDTGLARSERGYTGWLGLECASVHRAIWMMRALVAGNVVSRREEAVLFVPVNAALDPGGDRVVRAVTLVHGLAAAKGIE
jgi:hypothetical protein